MSMPHAKGSSLPERNGVRVHVCIYIYFFFYMYMLWGGPKTISHIFNIWGSISQKHRASVTLSFMARMILCNSAPSSGTFCEHANYTH